MSARPAFRIAELAARVGGEVLGDGDVAVHQVSTLTKAQAGEISFLHNPKYRRQLSATQASAVIVSSEVAVALRGLPPDQRRFVCLIVDNPHAAYAEIAAILNPATKAVAGVHPSAVVEGAVVPVSASLGPGVVLGKGVVIGERVVIRAHTVLADGVFVGDDCVLYSHVTVYEGCRLGNRVIVHSGAVIGADGFGFAPSPDGWRKVPQIAGVDIGDDVEIGANTTIDRGALTPTVIGKGCKLDNQIQIGHNCVIGEHTVIAGCVGIAGSTHVGSWCAIGGAAMILGHLEIADRCEISPGSMVMKTIARPGKYTALMPLDTHENWLSNAAHLRRLQTLANRVGQLEKQLQIQREQGH